MFFNYISVWKCTRTGEGCFGLETKMGLSENQDGPVCLRTKMGRSENQNGPV